MSNLQDYQAYVQLDRQVQGLEQAQQRRAGSVQTDAYQFRLSPTCPPSTSIRFNSGLAWWPLYAFYPTPILIPSYEVDLTDSAKVSVRLNYSSYTYTFTNPNWYAPCIAVISRYGMWNAPQPWPDTAPDDTLYLYGGVGSPYMEEFETAAEAEAALMEIVGERAAYYGIAAGGLILRNNGNVDFENQYMEVDPINRGRSYLFGAKRYGWEMG